MISRDIIELAAVEDISELWAEDGKQLLEGTLSFSIQENRRFNSVESLLSEESCDGKKM